MVRDPNRRMSPWLAFAAGVVVATGLILGYLAVRESWRAAPRALSVQLDLPNRPPLPDAPRLPPPPIPIPK